MISLVGIAVLILVALALSRHRRAIKWRTVGGAFAIQVLIGAFALYVPWGQATLQALANGVSSLQGYANKGIEFLFGGLGSAQMFEVFGDGGFVFAIKVLPVIVFFGSFISVMYYIGVMGWIIRIIGGTLRLLLGTSRVESMVVTSAIFVGQSEVPLVVRPFIASLTRSELFAVMVGGFAAVAGSVLLGYAGLGVELKYLIAACFMAAPGALLMAKLMEPETEAVREASSLQVLDDHERRPANLIDAAAEGAQAACAWPWRWGPCCWRLLP